MDKPKREDGFYWVRRNYKGAGWIVAQYDGSCVFDKEPVWRIPDSDSVYGEDEFAALDEHRLLPPEPTP